MTRPRRKFICQSCGYESAKWLGRCPDCGQWNSFAEEIDSPAVAGHAPARTGEPPVAIGRVPLADCQRYASGFGELDRVLGGGVVPGSLVLVGGDPGIGKSTLLLQLSHQVSEKYGPVLYVSGEESAAQTRLRADRLGTLSENLFVHAETNLDVIGGYLESIRPRMAVIDSIQTVYQPDLAPAPGSVTQVREGAARLLRIAKSGGTAIFIVGHVTKSGALAGPRILEHIVDTVLYFEGERHHDFRILRAVKNRFGSTNEVGLFRMSDRGLEEVVNPSELFLAERPLGAAGSVAVSSLEGTRPLVVELQALVASSGFGTPRRTATGLDYNRVSLIIAVLERRVGLALGNQDAYLKIAGGARIDEPAVDLGIALAIASSYRDVPADPKTVVMGEVGLAGEVRAISRLEERIREAEKLGFARCLVPRSNVRAGDRWARIEVCGVDTVEQGIELALS